MKSAYYTFTTWDGGEQAAGFDGGLGSDRQTAAVGQPGQKARALGGDNVVDLAAWKAANRELWDEPDELDELDQEYALEEVEQPAPAHRARRSHRTTWIDPELASILGVVAVLAVLMIRVLLF